MHVAELHRLPCMFGVLAVRERICGASRQDEWDEYIMGFL